MKLFQPLQIKLDQNHYNRIGGYKLWKSDVEGLFTQYNSLETELGPAKVAAKKTLDAKVTLESAVFKQRSYVTSL